MPGPSTRAVWLPWMLAACLAVIAGVLAYERFSLKLIVDDFLLRDRAQQGELDKVQGRETALQRRLDDALSRIAASGKEKADLQTQLAALRGEMAELRTRDALSPIKITILASMLKESPHAMAVVAWDSGARRGILKTVNMPAAGAGQDYQLWIIDPAYRQPVSAGVFDPVKGARFQPPRPVSQANQFAISLEKKGGAPVPQGPIVLVGE